MALLSAETQEVLHAAAIEVLIRGVGDRRQYDYTIKDCLIVSMGLNRGRKWLLENPNYGETAINLFDVIVRQKKEPEHG